MSDDEKAGDVAGEAYQVIGNIAARLGVLGHPDVERALDHFSGDLSNSIIPFAMTEGSELEKWAVAERQFIKDELRWLRLGAKLTSPSGEDITARKIEELEQRLEHAQQSLSYVPIR